MFDPLDDPPDHRDIAIEMARRMADHGVKLGTAAGVGGQVAADADGAVAVDGRRLESSLVATGHPRMKLDQSIIWVDVGKPFG